VLQSETRRPIGRNRNVESDSDRQDDAQSPCSARRPWRRCHSCRRDISISTSAGGSPTYDRRHSLRWLAESVRSDSWYNDSPELGAMVERRMGRICGGTCDLQAPVSPADNHRTGLLGLCSDGRSLCPGLWVL